MNHGFERDSLPLPVRVAIRGYKNRVLIFEERLELGEYEVDVLLPAIGREHVLRMGGEPHMIEIEFLDELDPLKRYFRFGTDPRQMRRPVRL